MGKGYKTPKLRVPQARRELNVTELTELCQAGAVPLTTFQDKVHYRIHGLVDVDYWPASSKAWELGSQTPALYVEPAVAIGWAVSGARP